MNTTRITTDTRKFGRRYGRFSLRLLLLLITVCAVALGNYCIKQRRELCVAEIVKANGGSVNYAHQFSSDDLYIPNAAPPGPTWLRAILGEEFVSDIRGVHVYDITDDQLKTIAECDCLEYIHLIAKQHAVKDLTPLANCRNLCRFKLEGLAWNDQHLLPFLSHPFGLKGLVLKYAQITDEGLVALQAFPELESLEIEGAPVSGAGLEHLSSRCKTLVLNGPAVGSVVLPYLSKLPQLAAC